MAQHPTRLEIQTLLEALMGTNPVYFQPPPTVQMQYPCLVYERDYAYTEFAGNYPYLNCKRYQVTVIDRDPDSTFPDKVAALPMSAFNRHFTADNLNHDVFQVFF
jgi:hypothetical protein